MRHAATGLLAAALLMAGTGSAAPAQETRLVLVTGLGGDPAYTEAFHEWASTLREGAIQAGVPAERIVWLGEKPELAPDAIAGRSTLDNLTSQIHRLASEAGPSDRILLALIGHGTSRSDEARFNLPGPDVTGAELASLLEAFETQTVAVVNTAPASGPWVQALAGPGRIVVTATKTARERNETQFGRYFAEAFGGGDADLDKDGRTSLLEAFRFAVREVERYYDERNLLPTEHAVLDDDGDGRGTERFGSDGRPEADADARGEPTDDGPLAARFWLAPPSSARGVPEAAVPEGVTDPELRALYEERAALERAVVDLRARKDEMEAEAYEARLEELLVELALKNREITQKGGGR